MGNNSYVQALALERQQKEELKRKIHEEKYGKHVQHFLSSGLQRIAEINYSLLDEGYGVEGVFDELKSHYQTEFGMNGNLANKFANAVFQYALGTYLNSRAVVQDTGAEVYLRQKPGKDISDLLINGNVNHHVEAMLMTGKGITLADYLMENLAKPENKSVVTNLYIDNPNVTMLDKKQNGEPIEAKVMYA